MLLSFIGGPLHSDTRHGDFGRTYKYTEVVSYLGSNKPVDTLIHAYDWMDLNSEGRGLYLYRGIVGASCKVK